MKHVHGRSNVMVENQHLSDKILKSENLDNLES